VKEALDCADSTFQAGVLNMLISMLAQFGCQQVPALSYEFLIKSAAVLSLMHNGVPSRILEMEIC